MSIGQRFRDFMNERLAVAAEEIYAFFERTIMQYEEELHRSKQENQNKQHILNHILSRRNVLVRKSVPMSPYSPGLNQDIPETLRIKEEPDEQLPVSVPECSAPFVTTEEITQIQIKQIKSRKDGQENDIKPEPHFHAETERDTEQHFSDVGGPPFSCSAAEAEKEPDEGEHTHQDEVNIKLFPQTSSEPEASRTAENLEMSQTDSQTKEHQCIFCQKRFGKKTYLTRHITVHTREKSYSCDLCEKQFVRRDYLVKHKRIHTGDKPYDCCVCGQTFTQKSSLNTHIRRHTGERPFSCPTCNKTFVERSSLKRHGKTHTGESSVSEQTSTT